MNLSVPPAADALHPRVLVRVDPVLGAAREHLLELVGAAVVRRQDQHVGDVIEEPGTRAGVATVAVVNATREEVELAVVEDRAGIEDRPVALDRTVVDERVVAHPAHRDARPREGEAVLGRVPGHRRASLVDRSETTLPGDEAGGPTAHRVVPDCIPP